MPIWRPGPYTRTLARRRGTPWHLTASWSTLVRRQLRGRRRKLAEMGRRQLFLAQAVGNRRFRAAHVGMRVCRIDPSARATRALILLVHPPRFLRPREMVAAGGVSETRPDHLDARVDPGVKGK